MMSKVCYLCGNTIESKLNNDPMGLSMDHVPPKQFYLKQIRERENLNLQLAPSHKKCNEDYKLDGEYFYHSLYPIVADNNPKMGNIFLQDMKRRSQKPQTPAMVREILSMKFTTTEGGIHLPKGKVGIYRDELRLQRVAAKIVRGILFLSTGRYFEYKQIIDMRFCINESELIELYRIAWQTSPISGVYPNVFSYKHFFLDGFHYLSMVFWGAFMVCATIEETTGIG
jgi:hypothetical protein